MYAYLGYPVVLWILTVGRKGGCPPGGERFEPGVTLLISAHNEEGAIEGKLDNCRDLDYPPDLLEVIVVSDASTDATDRRVREREGQTVSLFRLPERLGKVEGINRAVAASRSEIVVLTDANTMLHRESIRRMIRHFADPGVGLVSGELRLSNRLESPAGRGESAYWRYECRIRRWESKLGRIMGATGPIYSFRRDLFRPVPANMFCDLVLPLRIAISGSRTVYEPMAMAFEEAAPSVLQDVRRRFRNGSRGSRSVREVFGAALRQGRWGVVLQLISHKILRWISFPLVLGLLIATPQLTGSPFGWLTLLELVFLLSVLLGGILDWAGARRNPFFAPYYLMMAHAALFLGVLIGLFSRGKPFWSPRGA